MNEAEAKLVQKVYVEIQSIAIQSTGKFTADNLYQALVAQVGTPLPEEVNIHMNLNVTFSRKTPIGMDTPAASTTQPPKYDPAFM